MTRTRDRYGQTALPESMGAGNWGRAGDVIAGPPRRKRVYSRWGPTIKIGGRILFILLVLGLIVAGVRLAAAVQEYGERNTVLANPAFKVRYNDLGATVVNRWFNGGPAPISTGEGVTWPGGAAGSGGGGAARQLSVTEVGFISGGQVPLQSQGLSDDDAGFYVNPYVEHLEYTVSLNGTPARVTVTIGIPNLDDPTAQPILLAPPAMAPSPPVGTTDMSTNPRDAGLTDLGGLDSGAQAQLQNWARAWTANDGQSLKQISQDQSDRQYAGLGGPWQFQPGGGQFTSAWQYRTTIDGDEYVVAEVSFNIAAAVGNGATAGATGGARVNNVQTMDLLLANYDSGLPAVVAWGPAGSWPTLRPFQNGVPGAEPQSSTVPQTPEPLTPATTAPGGGR